MAFSTNTVWNFSTTGHYTYDATITVGSGKATLNAGESSGIITSSNNITTSSWDAINSLSLTFKEGAGYSHRFVFSFDGGTTWKYFTGSWQVVPGTVNAAAIAIYGTHARGVEKIKTWPIENTFAFKCLITRDTVNYPSATGELDLITINYLGSGASIEELSVGSGEPADSGDTLESDLGYQPSYPIRREFVQEVLTQQSANNVPIRRAKGQVVRAFYPDLRWSGVTKSESTTIINFIEDHYETAFSWAAPGEIQNDSADRFYVCVGTPERKQIAYDVYEVTAAFLEVFPNGP